MSEALRIPDNAGTDVKETHLYLVPDTETPTKKEPTKADAQYDLNGKVVRPSIDVKTGMMRNGQPLDVFYGRNNDDVDDVEQRISAALADAKRFAT